MIRTEALLLAINIDTRQASMVKGRLAGQGGGMVSGFLRSCLTVAAAALSSPLLAQSTGIPVQEAAVPPRASTTSNPTAAIGVGGDMSEGGFSLYGASTVALNGDLYETGVLVRTSIGGGQYKAGQTPFAVGTDVSFYSGGFMLGYQKRSDSGTVVAGYLGPEVVHNGQGADPRVRGTTLAARVIGEVYVPGKDVDLSIWSSYSSFEDQYFISGRSMFRNALGKSALGPDLAFFGGDGWQRGRAGANFTIPTTFGEIALGGGYDFDLKGGANESPYGRVGLSLPF